MAQPGDGDSSWLSMLVAEGAVDIVGRSPQLELDANGRAGARRRRGCRRPLHLARGARTARPAPGGARPDPTGCCTIDGQSPSVALLLMPGPRPRATSSGGGPGPGARKGCRRAAPPAPLRPPATAASSTEAPRPPGRGRRPRRGPRSNRPEYRHAVVVVGALGGDRPRLPRAASTPAWRRLRGARRARRLQSDAATSQIPDCPGIRPSASRRSCSPGVGRRASPRR